MTDLARHGRDVVALPVLAEGPAMVHAFEAALTDGTHREGRGAVLQGGGGGGEISVGVTFEK